MTEVANMSFGPSDTATYVLDCINVKVAAGWVLVHTSNAGDTMCYTFHRGKADRMLVQESILSRAAVALRIDELQGQADRADRLTHQMATAMFRWLERGYSSKSEREDIKCVLDQLTSTAKPAPESSSVSAKVTDDNVTCIKDFLRELTGTVFRLRQHAIELKNDEMITVLEYIHEHVCFARYKIVGKKWPAERKLPAVPVISDRTEIEVDAWLRGRNALARQIIDPITDQLDQISEPSRSVLRSFIDLIQSFEVVSPKQS